MTAPTNNEIVYQCIVELHNAGRIPTREVIMKETGLKFSIVDDHVKRLRDDGKIEKVVNGVFEPVKVFEEFSPSVTMLDDGRVKVEYGEGILTLTRKGARDIGSLLSGFGMSFGRG